MGRRSEPARRLRPPCAVLWPALAAGSCVTTIVEPPPPELPSAAPVRVELDTGATVGGTQVASYYGSVLGQLQDAARDRDVEWMHVLIAQHGRDDAPPWALERFEQFRALTAVLEYERHAMAGAMLDEAAGADLGDPMEFTFRIPAGGPPLRLGGEGDSAAARFAVAIEVEDFDCWGNRTSRSSQRLLSPPAAVATDREPVEIRFGVAELEPEGVLRRLRVTVDWLPGQVTVEGALVPNNMTPCVSRRVEVYPPGVDAIRARPLATLRAAVGGGDPAHFGHIVLATRFLPEEDLDAAITELVAALRVGRADLGRVCTVALRELTGQPISLDDRDGWLRWASRRPHR